MTDVNDVKKPIVVSESQGGVDSATATFRYIVVTLMTYAVARGWVDAENVDGIVAILVALGTAGYGIFKTWRRGAEVATVAASPKVPNTIAQIK